jgi:preprotein translocase subunit SecD
MEFRELAKEWRIWVLVFSLLVSTALLVPWSSPTLFFDTSGEDIGFQTNLEDRTSIEFSGGTRMLLELETNETGQDLEDLADEVRTILEIRLSNSNIPDPSVRTVNLGGDSWRVQVQSATQEQEQLRSIVEREGSYETRMPLPIQNQKNFSLGDYTYGFQLDNRTVKVTGFDNDFSTSVTPGERFSVSDNGISNYNTTFVYADFNESTSTAEMEVIVYTGEAIKQVVEGDSQITGSAGSGYEFRFPVIISQNAAQNRLEIAQNYGSRPYQGIGSQSYLTLENGDWARSLLYVDGNMESRLLMASVFSQSAETRSTISGPGETHQDAVEARDEMVSILKSGSLPVSVDVVSASTLSSSLGSQFMSAAILSIIGSLIAVGVLVFIRYQDPRVVIPLVLTGASEVYILLGAYFTTIGTLSLSAVAGIIAAVGTGVDDQIIITDESGKQDLGGWQKKMKRAFFVIFTSAASTIGAMAPILAPGAVSTLIGIAGASLIGYTLYKRGTHRHYIGIGIFAVAISAFTSSLGPSGAALSTIHEFARTTILGILVGIAITRPAYAKTIEYIKQ